MTSKFDARNIHQDKLIWFFLISWTLLNILQAATLELHADEAYYWLYSRFLDWGYYDHPPMVAVFIRAGYSLFKNEFGVRLLTIISSTGALAILWQTLREYKVDARLFIMVVSGMFIFHIYGFITTPDAPLFFFTVLFYYLFNNYLKADKWQTALLIAITLTCLLYSKYHGVLIVLLTIGANIRLLKRPTFWLIVILATVLYFPHIWWQISHNYPSVEYHLFERTSEIHGIANTLLFPIGQVLMAGPLVGWLIFYYAFKVKIKDAFIRTLIVNAVGTLIFFWLSTVKGEVQPHWTLIAFVPVTLLALIYFSQGFKPPKWFKILAFINITLIILLRFALIIKVPFIVEKTRLGSLFNYKKWTEQIHKKAGDAYVIFSDGFQDPAKYCFYTQSLKGFSYDNRFYRRTQYEFWPIEDYFQGKPTFCVATQADSILKDTLNTTKGKLWYGWVNHTRTYQRVYVTADHYKITAMPGQKLMLRLKLDNPYPYTVKFSNAGQQHKLFFAACFLQSDNYMEGQRAANDFYNLEIKPGQSEFYNFALRAPLKKGVYDVIFSLRTTPFPGGRNSRIVKFIVQ